MSKPSPMKPANKKPERPFIVERSPAYATGNVSQSVRVRRTGELLGTVEKRAINVYAFGSDSGNPSTHSSVLDAARYLYANWTSKQR